MIEAPSKWSTGAKRAAILPEVFQEVVQIMLNPRIIICWFIGDAHPSTP
jgi:hypothetical protein